MVAPDGTVYVGNMDGELMAFHANGAPYWQRKINPEHGGFYAAPVVGGDGSIYLVSSKPRAGNNTLTDSFLHKFLPGGGWLGGQAFPTRGSDGGATTAPPNIWRHNGVEAIIVPAKYKHYSFERRLIAFSTNQSVIDDKLVSFTPIEITATRPLAREGIAYGAWNLGIGCAIAFGGFDAPTDDSVPSSIDLAGYPMAGVAIQQSGQGGAAPTIMVADGNYARVGYSFSPQTGFTESFRVTDNFLSLKTPPVALPDGNVVVGSYYAQQSASYLLFTAGAQKVGHRGLPGPLTAPPTRMHDGTLAVVGRGGYLTLLTGAQVSATGSVTIGTTSPAARRSPRRRHRAHIFL